MLLDWIAIRSNGNPFFARDRQITCSEENHNIRSVWKCAKYTMENNIVKYLIQPVIREGHAHSFLFHSMISAITSFNYKIKNLTILALKE